MLDINQTQIVSREDLIPPKSPEPILQTVDWSSVLGYTVQDDSPAQDDDISIASASDHDHPPAEVSFRLFAPTKDDTDNVQSYILPASPPPEQQALLAASLTADTPQVSHFSEQNVQNAHATHRPASYYLTPPLEEDEPRAVKVRDAAVSGEQVLEESRKRWPGCELSWRVMKLSLASDSGATPDSKNGAASTSESSVVHAIPSTRDGRRRHRPNKKRRIILRKRRVVKEEKEAKTSKNAIKKKKKRNKTETTAAVKAVVHKRTEEEDREKRTRLNRLKKVKRKNKLKEKTA